MKYLMLIKHAESVDVRDVPQALMDAMGTLVTDGLKSGAILDTAGLKPTRDGFRVRLDGGLMVTDGPFTETKEVIGGYALMQFERLFHLAAPPFQLRLPRARTFEGGVLPAVDQADATAR